MPDVTMTLKGLAAIGWCWIVGCGLVALLTRRLDRPTFYATGLLMGVGAIGLELFVFGWLGVAWHVQLVIAASLPVAAAGVLVAARRGLDRGLAPSTSTIYSLRLWVVDHPVELALGAVLVVLVVAYTLSALIWPVGPGRSPDGYGYYLLKARMFYLDGGFEPFFEQSQQLGYTAPDYPILIPLTIVWLYTAAGGIDERLAAMLGAAFVLAGSLLFYAQARRLGLQGRRAAALTLFLGLSLVGVNVTQVGYTDGPLAVYLLVGSGFAALFLRDWRPEDAILAAAGFGFAAWTKNEGIALHYASVLALLSVMVYGFISRRQFVAPLVPSVILCLAPVLMLLPWTQLKAQNGIDVVVLGGATQIVERLGERLIPSLAWLILRVGLYWNALLLLALVILALAIWSSVGDRRSMPSAVRPIAQSDSPGSLPDLPPATLYLCLLLLASVASFVLAVLTSPDPLQLLLRAATPRLVIQITPIFAVLVATLITLAPSVMAATAVHAGVTAREPSRAAPPVLAVRDR
jgi:hypothetical protein